jgi:hypothetical protein
VPRGNTVTDHEREQVGTENAKHTADRSPDQTLQADQTKSPLEGDNGNPEQSSDYGIKVRRQVERLKFVTSKRNKKNK